MGADEVPLYIKHHRAWIFPTLRSQAVHPFARAGTVHCFRWCTPLTGIVREDVWGGNRTLQIPATASQIPATASRT